MRDHFSPLDLDQTSTSTSRTCKMPFFETYKKFFPSFPMEKSVTFFQNLNKFRRAVLNLEMIGLNLASLSAANLHV